MGTAELDVGALYFNITINRVTMSGKSQSMSSLLECPICFEPFSDPRMLTSCFHTLCQKCLSDHITHFGEDGQFQCPICRASVEIPGDGAEAFPKNFFVNSCMDAVNTTSVEAREETSSREQLNDKNTVCSNSDGGDLCTQPEDFCSNCCEYYCKTCSSVHRRSKATRSHTLIPIDALTDEVLRDAKLKSETPRCLKHKEELKLYCMTCKSAVCYVCSQISHQSHTFNEITAVDQDLKSELEKAVTILQQLVCDVEEQTDKVTQSQLSLDTNSATARETMKSISQKMHQMIDEKAEEIDQKICQINKDGEAKTAGKNKHLTLHAGQLQSLHTYARDLLRRGTVYNRLASLPEVRGHLQRLQNSSPDLVDVVPSSFHLIAESVQGLVLEEEVTLEGNDASLKIAQKCSIIPDKVFLRFTMDMHVGCSYCTQSHALYIESRTYIHTSRRVYM